MGLILPPSFVARQRESDKARKDRARAGLKKHATMAIQAVYPEHLFTCEVDEHGNIFVDHLLLTESKARYFCRYDDYQDGKGVVKLAGELLERVSIKRGELKHYEEYDVAAPLAATQFKAK